MEAHATGAGMSKMGSRNMSAPAFTGDGSVASSSADPQSAALLQELLRRMPTQYALATSFADRLHHAQLLSEMPATAKPGEHTAVRIAWEVEQDERMTVWLVFPDRRGSLGLITSLLSELGINIGKASAFSSTDGIAVDTFTVDKCALPPPPHTAPAAAATSSLAEDWGLPVDRDALCARQNGCGAGGHAARAARARAHLSVGL